MWRCHQLRFPGGFLSCKANARSSVHSLRIIWLSPLSLATDVTLGTSDPWLGARTWGGGTATLAFLAAVHGSTDSRQFLNVHTCWICWLHISKNNSCVRGYMLFDFQELFTNQVFENELPQVQLGSNASRPSNPKMVTAQCSLVAEAMCRNLIVECARTFL